ncbi:MAG TPA: hypothetical protein VFZ08_06480 [Terriglobia bacterium]|nr:hypothetical protein [Terriglobia bacterium]
MGCNGRVWSAPGNGAQCYSLTMSFVYVFAATAMEAKALGRGATRGRSGSGASEGPPGAGGPNTFELFITGIGPRAARSCSTQVIEPFRHGKRPDAALVIGTCGSLSPQRHEGEIVVYTKCLPVSVNKQPLVCAKALAGTLNERLDGCGISYARVAGITSDRMAATPEEKLRWARMGAEVVDMESYEIVEVMAGAGIPVAVVRAVSDSLDRGLPDFNPALRANGEVDKLAAARIAARSPLHTMRFVMLHRKAVESLRTALDCLLSADFLP